MSKKLQDKRYIIETSFDGGISWVRHSGCEYQSWLIKNEIASFRRCFSNRMFRALEFVVEYIPWTYTKPKAITSPIVTNL
jgi:hypothetical protein